MKPDDIIESYVDEVVRFLPRRQRSDVGFELRSLLKEDLEGRAAESGRPVDAQATLELLTAFGSPQDVADRYRPAGFTIIRPSNAPRFAWLALGGMALIWAVTLPVSLFGPSQIAGWEYGADAWWGRLIVWWWGAGLGAFWWPGFLFTLTLIAALFERRRGEAKPWTPPRRMDRGPVTRVGMALALAFWTTGAALLIALPWLSVWAPGLPQSVLDAFLFDPEFLTWRAPWILMIWATHFAVYIAVLVVGRWSPLATRISLLVGVGFLGLIAWWLLAGPIFSALVTDGTVKPLLALIALIVVIDIVATVRRSAGAIRPPVA